MFEMELIALGAIVALDVLALELGLGGRQKRALDREDIARLESDIARDAWRLF